jgi:hypothetical protein
MFVVGAIGAGCAANDCERQLKDHAQKVRESKDLANSLDAYKTKIQALLGFNPEVFTPEEKQTLWYLFEKNEEIHEEFNECNASYPIDFESVKNQIFGDMQSK